MEFLDAAAKAGAPAAASTALENEDELEEAMRQLGLPLVIKCDHSWGGEGVVIAATREEARAAFRRMNSRRACATWRGRCAAGALHFLTRALYPGTGPHQRPGFVSGAPATSSIACWQGKVVAAHHFDVLLSTTPTSPASVIAPVHCPQMAAAADRRRRGASICRACSGWTTSATRSGQVHLLEMNARATPTTPSGAGRRPARGPAAGGRLGGPHPPGRRPTGARDRAFSPRMAARSRQPLAAAAPSMTCPGMTRPWCGPASATAPPAARAALEASAGPALTQKRRVFGG